MPPTLSCHKSIRQMPKAKQVMMVSMTIALIIANHRDGEGRDAGDDDHDQSDCNNTTTIVAEADILLTVTTTNSNIGRGKKASSRTDIE